MTQQEILEGNKLIAEFIQLRGEYDEDKDLIYLESDIDGKGVYSLSELKYHTSWDWLMPCINKINFSDHLNLWDKHNIDKFNLTESITNVDIERTYELIIKFIKWYNEECTE